ncbi:MAG: NAD-dependent epimerase/dehydratase family protein, partial [Sphaerospermopsis kisseleviana]
FEKKHGGQIIILRPSMIYGRNYLWNAFLGSQLGEGRWLQIKTQATIPITYVENCAEAIIMATECSEAIGKVFNIVDDNLPIQATYVSQLIERTSPRPRIILIHWEAIDFLARIIWKGNQWLFKGRAKLPGILIPDSLHARFKPFNYSNCRLKQAIDWAPKYSLEVALDRSFSNTDLLSIPATEVS